MTEKRGGSALRGVPAVVAGLLAWNVGNYAYLSIAGHILGPSHYATVAALLAATLFVQIPAGAVQVAMGRGVAELHGDAAGSAWLLRHLSTWCAAAGLGAGAAAVVSILVVAPDVPVAAVLFAGLTIAPLPVFMLASGYLQGHRRFGSFGLSQAMLGIPRPLGLLAALPLMTEVSAAMAGSALAIVVAAVVAMWAAWPRGVAPPVQQPRAVRDQFVRGVGPLAAGLVGFGVLMNLDVVVARAGLTPHVAGLFSAAAVLAKATVILPQAVSWVLLPRVVASHKEGRSTARLLGIGLAATAVVGVLAAAVSFVIARPVIGLVFGREFREGAGYLVPLIGAATLIGLLLLLMNHQLSRGVHGFAWALAVVGAVQALALWRFHGSPSEIVAVEAIVAAAGVVVYEVMYGRTDAGLVRAARALLTERGALT